MSIERSCLQNGLRIVSHAMPHLETLSLGVWVEAGACSETPREGGISHFLEHMAFKGTTKRSARDIVEEIENVGGDINAATGLEMTTYHVRLLKEDLSLGLDILSDILQNPRFDSDEFSREREVILQEIAATQDSPDDLAYDLLQEVAFPGQALGRPISGTTQTVQSFEPDHLRSYFQRHYSADRMILSAAGALEHDVLHKEAEKFFSGISRGSGKYLLPATNYCGGMRRLDKSFEQNHLVLAFEGISYSDDDYFAAQILSALFGGGMSSRLFQEVRERLGLCYTIYSFSWSFVDTGLFGLHAATGAEQLPELLAVVVKELKRMTREVPSDEEVQRAKMQLKAGLLMSLESSGTRADQLARQIFAFGHPLESARLIERVEEVTPERVRRIAERILSKSKPSSASVGPPTDDKCLDQLGSCLC